ncbi:GNAT family N-acetyltransferase [Dictyobacter formicarum]|uniref:N-acetyltransferase n=1 Tax=Dictyobacter formicarum TaxID=2778368 RepID=A0ABQ3VUD9_9CHLR|nr:GNAT family N-acetyltransferase [Dictyobacter formicarum]GHO89585.1 N-acetyltransferase [Dictyobacter formicarum]
MEIRPARPEDAPLVVPLFIQAMDDIASTLAGSEQPHEVQAFMTTFFQLPGNRLSYQNTLVAEEDQQVVGVLILYHGNQAAALDQPIIARLRELKNDPNITLDKEAEEDEWYIDTLSVSPRYGGRGIGTALLRAAEEHTSSGGPTKIALLVDKNSQRAYRLYQHLNYQQDAVVQISHHPYLHMTKNLGGV